MYASLRSQGLGGSSFKVKAVPKFEAFGAEVRCKHAWNKASQLLLCAEVRFSANYILAGEGCLGAVIFKDNNQGHACMPGWNRSCRLVLHPGA